jgi:hypothetical protein
MSARRASDGIVTTRSFPRASSDWRATLSIGIRLVGQAAKHRVTRRIPAPGALIDDLEAWLREDAKEMLVALRRPPDHDGRVALRMRLHPAAGEVEIAAAEGGRVSAVGATAEVGPGYHTYLAHLFRRLGAENNIAWEPPDVQAGTGDLTGFFETGRRADAEGPLLVWLRDTLQRACDQRALGGQPVDLIVSTADRFTFDGAIATPLGPRDDAWLSTALANPRVAVEMWPWFADVTDARYLLNRALCLMWTEVRWRPAIEEGEPEVVDEVLRLLRRAFPLDPSLPYPWREWKELLDIARDPDPMRDRVEGEAAAAPDGPLIGYRRQPVRVEQAGWQITVPGSFATLRTDEELRASGGDRIVTIAASPTGTDAAPMAAETFLERVAGHLGNEVLHHRAGEVVARAKLAIDPTSAVEMAVLEGYAGVRGSGAAIRIVIHDPADFEWALDMWRSLRPV